jgi:hypothetical protein
VLLGIKSSYTSRYFDKATLDEETRAWQNEVARLPRENSALLKSNRTILESLSENVRRIRFNTN